MGIPHRVIEIHDATDSLRLTQAELKRIYDANLAFIDYETTGLDPEDNAITEVALSKVVHENGEYRVKTFNPFVFPMRPEYEQYLEREALGHDVAYDRRKYEYDISLQALAITGTEFRRSRPGGPIVGVSVVGKEKQAYYWHEVMPQMMAFIGDRQLTAYNGKFDMGFSKAKLEEILSGETPSRERLEAILQGNPLPADMVNPAQMICQMYTFMRYKGQGASNRLEDFRRKLLDASAGEREEHSGMEDVFIMMEGASKMLEHYGRPMTISDIYADLVHTADPNAEVLWYENGDVEIRFSQDPATLNEKSALLWQFLVDFRDARVRNGYLPHHVDGIDADAFSIRLRAGDKQPLLLNLLKKFMIYEEMLEGGFIESAHLYDSTARVDVILKDETGEVPAPHRTVRDVPMSSLRKSYEYFRSRPETAAGNMELMKTLELSEQIGLAIFHEQDGLETITIAPYNRDFGNVKIQLPKGRNFADYRNDILANLRDLAPLGVAPDTKGAAVEHSEADEESPYASTFNGLIYYSIRLGERTPIRIGVKPELYATVWRMNGMPDGLHVERNEDGDYMVSGPLEDIRKYGALLNDARWILHRIEQVPGTHRVEVRDGVAVLRQDWGVDIDALTVLTQAGVPFTATEDRIILNLDELMADSFQWSKALEVQITAAKKNRRLKNPEEAPQALRVLQERLLDGGIIRMDSDLVGGVTVFDRDGTAYPIPNGVDEVVLSPSQDDGLILTRSTVASLGGFLKDPHHPGRILMHPALCGLLQERLDYTLLRSEAENGLVSVTIPRQPNFVSELETCARLLHQLSMAHGLERYPIANVTFENGRVRFYPPASDLFRENHYNVDIAEYLDGMANQANQRRIVDILEMFPFPTVLEDLRSQDVTQVIGNILHAYSELEAFLPNLQQLEYISGTHDTPPAGAEPLPVLTRAHDAYGRLMHKRAIELGRFDRADHTLKQIRKGEDSSRLQQVHEGIYEGKLLVGNIGRSLDRIREDTVEVMRLIANPHPMAMPLRRAVAEWMLQHEEQNAGYHEAAQNLLLSLYQEEPQRAYAILDTYAAQKQLEQAVANGDPDAIEKAVAALYPLKPESKKNARFNASQERKSNELLQYIAAGGDIASDYDHFTNRQLTRAVSRVREALENLQKSMQYGHWYLSSTQETLLNSGITARRITGFDPALERYTHTQLESALTHTGTPHRKERDGSISMDITDLAKLTPELTSQLQTSTTYTQPQQTEIGLLDEWRHTEPEVTRRRGRVEQSAAGMIGLLRHYVGDRLNALLNGNMPEGQHTERHGKRSGSNRTGMGG